MAKKATATKSEVAPQPTVAKTAPVQKQSVKPKWEYKNRTYYLSTGKSPLIFTLPAKHNGRKPLLWFDEESGYQRELRYATNQASPFVDEQKGQVTLGRIVFRDGVLTVKKEDVALQKLLSLYHPLRNKIYKELDKEANSVNELEWIEFELEALTIAKNIDIDHAEAILRSEYGEKVTTLSTSELKRDLMIFAKRNPSLFIELANDDSIQLRNTGAKAVEAGILRLSADQRTFTYGESNRKLMTVPFDEHPYSALASYFKTDDGMEVYKAILKKLN
jgi:hypothetical protein